MRPSVPLLASLIQNVISPAEIAIEERATSFSVRDLCFDPKSRSNRIVLGKRLGAFNKHIGIQILASDRPDVNITMQTCRARGPKTFHYHPEIWFVLSRHSAISKSSRNAVSIAFLFESGRIGTLLWINSSLSRDLCDFTWDF